MKNFNLYVSEEGVLAALTALRKDGHAVLARKWEDQLNHERQHQKAAAEAAAEEAELRASRAANATLTERQAHMLAAARAGKPGYWTWTGSLRERELHEGQLIGRWQSHSNMGGALRRMAARLVDEGLLESRGWKCTPAGLERLARWEAETGKSFPKPGDPFGVGR